MKKMVTVAALAAVAAAATLSYAGLPARTGVNGSLHDMNFYAGYAGGEVPHSNMKQDVYNRVCVFCHTPHNAIVIDEGQNPLPLWGNYLTVKPGVPYQWATPANDTIVIDQLAGPSRLCMTCHDGTIAIDAHISNGGVGKAIQNNGTQVLSGDRAIGSGDSELNLTHPIGFSWSDAVAKRNLPKGTTANQVDEIVTKDKMFATKIVASDVAGTYNTVTRNSNRTIDSVLYAKNGVHDIMTCATCHEVHNKENATQDAGPTGKTPNYFLYAKESESLICLSCHIK